MTQELQMQNSIANIDQMNALSTKIFQMPHYRKLGMDGIFMVVSYANSLGIDPLEALNGGLYNINGKIGMAAETMARLVRKAGHSITKDEKSDDTICILHGKRRDNGDTWTSSFSINDAKKAGIFKGSWEKYPAAMCYNRAMSFLFRQLFPDLAKNAGYCQDELEEIRDNEFSPAKETKTITINELSTEQKAHVDQIFEEFPDLKQKIESLLPSNSFIPSGFYQRIVKGAEIRREELKKKQEESFEQEILVEFSQ